MIAFQLTHGNHIDLWQIERKLIPQSADCEMEIFTYICTVRRSDGRYSHRNRDDYTLYKADSQIPWLSVDWFSLITSRLCKRKD